MVKSKKKVNSVFDEVNSYIRIYFHKSEKFFGPGIANLLELVGKHKNLRKACKAMGISYTKAWGIINRAERNLNIKLLKTKTGGIGGGNSELSSEACKLLTKYRKMCKKIDIYAKKVYKEVMLT